MTSVGGELWGTIPRPQGSPARNGDQWPRHRYRARRRRRAKFRTTTEANRKDAA